MTETQIVVVPPWNEVPNACKHGTVSHYSMNGSFIAEELPNLIVLDLEGSCHSVSTMGDEGDELSELSPRALDDENEPMQSAETVIVDGDGGTNNGDQMSSMSTSSSDARPTKQLRGARGVAAEVTRVGRKKNEELHSHFCTLAEKLVLENGKVGGCFLCMCNYCREFHKAEKKRRLRNHSDADGMDNDTRQALLVGIKEPERIIHNSRNCDNHLKKCQHYIIKQKEEAQDKSPHSSSPGNPETNACLASVSSSAKSMSAAEKKTPKYQASIWNFGTRPLTTIEMQKTNQLLVEFVVNIKLPFRVVDRPSFHCFVDSIWPFTSTKLPKRTKLKALVTQVAKKCLKDVHDKILKKKFEGHNIGLCVDGWETVSKDHVKGVITFIGGQA